MTNFYFPFLLIVSLVNIGSLAFLIYGIVHIAKTSDEQGANKVLWIVLSLFFGYLPILLYCLIYTKNYKLVFGIVAVWLVSFISIFTATFLYLL